MDHPEAPEKKEIFVLSGGVKIQTRICRSRDPKKRKEGTGVVILHPHPSFGGDFNNNVVVALSQALTREGYTACSFNFRGVGKSEGSSWLLTFGGQQLSDTRAICQYLIEHEGVSSLWIVGYSYGSVIGSAIVNDFNEIKGFVSVSSPIGSTALNLLVGYLFQQMFTRKPTYWILGTKDAFTSVSVFEKKLEEYKSGFEKDDPSVATCPPVSIIIEGGDHFWFGRERELCQLVSNWLSQQDG